MISTLARPRQSVGKPVRFGAESAKPLMFFLKVKLGGKRFAQLRFQELPSDKPGVNRIKISSSLTPQSKAQLDKPTAQELFRTWSEFTSVTDDNGKTFWEGLKNGVVSTTIQGKAYEIEVDNAFFPPDWRPGGGLA